MTKNCTQKNKLSKKTCFREYAKKMEQMEHSVFRQKNGTNGT